MFHEMAQTKRSVPRVAFPETIVGDLVDLRTFCAIVDMRSLTAVARATGESKATVSRRLARLERELGTALVRRNTRVVVPTEDGAAYRIRVAQVLELLGDANATVMRTRDDPHGHLRITAPPDIANALIAPLVATFVAKHAHVVVEVVPTAQLLDFDADLIDIALRASTKLPDSSLIAHKLTNLDVIAVASPDYLRANGTPKRGADLARHRVALLGLNSSRRALPWQRLDGPGKPDGALLQPAVVSADLAFLKEVALADGGITFMPSILVEREIADGRLRRVLPRQVIPGSVLYLMHRRTQVLPPKVRAFRDFILTSFGVRGRRAGEKND
jgi:DNA-binding transcriptional LysR family regulator